MPNEEMDGRAVPKRLGVSTAAAATFATGTVAGGARPAERYDDRDERVRAVESHASGVLTELAERGVIEDPSAEAFDLTERTTATRLAAATPVDAWNAIEYTDPENGRHTDHLMLSKSTPTHDLSLHVRPRLSEAYAVVATRGTDEEFAVDGSVRGDAGTSAEEVRVFPVLYEATYVDCGGNEEDGQSVTNAGGSHDPLVNC